MQAPRLVVAFIVGGTTYEEARAVAELNATGEKHEGWAGGLRVILGGTGVLNSKTFMSYLYELMANERFI
jgi:vacuolar protein sorting-associated protein 45